MTTSAGRHRSSPIRYLEVYKPVDRRWRSPEADTSNANIDALKTLLADPTAFVALREFNVRREQARSADDAWIDELYEVAAGRGVELFVDDLLIELE